MKQMLSLVIFVAITLVPVRAEYPGINSPATSAVPQSADPGITQTRVLGEVTQIDVPGKRIVVKTEAGNVVTVILEEKTEFLRVPPGEKSLDKAVSTTLAEISLGDKVYARGRVSDDHKSVPAQKLIVMVKGDIEKKHEQERADWRRRGVSGIIAALDPQAREITIQARAREGPKPLIIAAPDTITFRRYAPDSVKFSDAQESTFADLKVGDQLRALGNKSADGSRFTAEQIVSGSFRTIGGTVKSVSPDTNEIKIEMLGGKQVLVVAVNKDSMLRRIPPQIAMFLALRGQPGGEGGPGQRGGANAAAPGRQPSSDAGATRPMPQSNANWQGGPGGGRPRMDGGGDFQDMVERMPALTLAEIKPGDVIAVSSTMGTDPLRLTAITLVTGVDVILAAMQRARTPGRSLNLSTGLPNGVLDFGMSQP